ncbi:MAG TPA: serine kinase [Xanthobacteraceae bacterium]|jgi:serine kinase of HPr protein (carbohydrate metabolism regulator)|nr:serine kinase [Xanthobacteraceae bacterium]
MASAARPTVHATAVLVGARAILIRGDARSGKSRLALSILQAAEHGTLAFARLVADDRCRLAAAHGRLLVRPSMELAGLLEVRGVGLQRLPYEPVAVVGLVVDLAAADAERLPSAASRQVEIDGVVLRRLAVPSGATDPLPLVLASLDERVIIA